MSAERFTHDDGRECCRVVGAGTWWVWLFELGAITEGDVAKCRHAPRRPPGRPAPDTRTDRGELT